ncbi:MAG: MFS transporter, partial [Acidilobus sp.]
GVGATYAEAIWVPLGYLVSLSSFLLLFGRLADLRGRKRVFTSGFAVFTLATLMCALSSTPVELDAWRVVQGAGAAMILSASGAIITESYPRWERGKAFGYWSLAVYTGTTVGPVLGGAIVTARMILGLPSWRWVFMATVPPAAVGLALSAIRLRESRPPARGRLDLAGGALAFVGLWASLMGLTVGSFVGWSAPYEALLAAGILIIAAFILWEARAGSQALLDLSMFRSVSFSMGNLAALLNYSGYFFVPFFLSYYMIEVLGMRPVLASVPLLALSLTMVTISPISGWASDRLGARPLATTGMALIALGLLQLSLLGDRATLADITWRTLLIGVGMGLFSSPNTASVMGSAPRDRLAVASATLSVMRFTGQSLSVALAGALAAAYIPRPVLIDVFTGLRTQSVQVAGPVFVEGLRGVYWVMAILVIIGALASAMRGHR